MTKGRLPKTKLWWNVVKDKPRWQWIAPALATAASLGVYWASRRRAAGAMSAIALLKEDHYAIRELLARFERAKNISEQREIADDLLTELQIHAILEDELFYPAVVRAMGDSSVVDLAEAEHQQANGIMADLQSIEPEHPRFEAVFRQLATSVRKHIDQEEADIMTKIEQSPVDLNRLGARMFQRRKELKRQMAVPSLLV